MKKKMVGLILFLFLIGQVSTVQAKHNPFPENELFAFLHSALAAQLSLGDTYRTKQEISDILSPYFTNEYQTLFLDEHIFSEQEGYILYGTDSSAYFIPFFSYNEQTKIIVKQDKILVYEQFSPQLEGSEIWEKPLYETITLTKTNGSWKISGYDVSEETPILN